MTMQASYSDEAFHQYELREHISTSFFTKEHELALEVSKTKQASPTGYGRMVLLEFVNIDFAIAYV